MSAPARTTWPELLGVALVGTDRRGDAADVVLQRAALLGGGRRAGWQPPVAPSDALEPAPDETMAEASATALQILELLLSGAVRVAGGADPLVAEWFDRAARNRLRVPHRMIPAVLERATVNERLRTSAQAVVGERGRWVARQNPRWSWTEGVTDDAWETGTKQERLAHLRRVRAQDPQAGIALVETTWSSEAAGVRQKILEVLAEGLCDTDEPFFESASADRAPSVRALAESALDLLPSSSRVAARADRLATQVRIGGTLSRKLVLDDPGAVRDSARLVPLTWWTTHLGVAPAEVVALAHDDGALVAALVQAALRQRDAVWAEALLRAGEPDVAQTIALVGLVPSESGRLLRRLQGLGDKLPPVLTQWAASLGTALDPSVAPELEAWVGALADNDAARRKVREVIQALTLRATIEQEMP